MFQGKMRPPHVCGSGRGVPIQGSTHTSVRIEPAAALSTELSRRHHAAKKRTGPILGIAESVMQDSHDVEADVEADEVGER
jgi:hypothetical protein